MSVEPALLSRELAGPPTPSAPVLAAYADSVMNTFGPPKRVFVRGEGCHVWDADGRRYLDLLSGLAVNALGHAHPTRCWPPSPGRSPPSDTCPTSSPRRPRSPWPADSR